MKQFALGLFLCGFMAACDSAIGDELNSPTVGPETENRFPPLSVPKGFEAKLFACDPLIEYPSVIAVGPKQGTLFVAHDYMTGLGLEIVRRDEVRLISDSDSDGYADQSTVYAGEFNSIQGLAYHDGYVFVMHSPFLTRLRDTDGDGKADERRDLIEGLGLAPQDNPNRLHCANGVVAGHDGWLYLALGDRGCDVERPEGDRLLFQQGGILRCRIDGSDLHVFSSGLRNIYDVALDDELNVFVRDNENDGGDYMIRVCHCFFGSDHGYPYHYYERPAEAMPPLADLGRGSSAGGTSYLETSFPPEFQRSLYFCEWGRAVVRYEQSPLGSSFKPMTEIDFAAGAATDPYGFKPTDVVVDRDGSLLISDWCDGQRPKRGRGRIYRVSYAGPGSPSQQPPAPHFNCLRREELLVALNSASHFKRVGAQLELQQRRRKNPPDTAEGEIETATYELRALRSRGELNARARMHGLWSIVDSAQQHALDGLFWLTEHDPSIAVRVQALRAIGDVTDPVLMKDRLDAGPGDAKIASRVADIARKSKDARVQLEALIIFGRLRWSGVAQWIAANLMSDEPALLHAAQHALRQANDWPAVVALLDGSPRSRQLALHAIAEQRVPFIADELIKRLSRSANPKHRREYADALTRIVRAEPPWTYWNYRPAPRSAATVEWSRTATIVAALNRTLADRDFGVRGFALSRMLREDVQPDFDLLKKWLKAETDEKRLAGLLTALRASGSPEVAALMKHTVQRSDIPDASRLLALIDVIAAEKTLGADGLVELAIKMDDDPVLAALLNELGQRPKAKVDEILMSKLDARVPSVRAAAVRSLGRRKYPPARRLMVRYLKDLEPSVQLAAVDSAGLLQSKDTIDELLILARSKQPQMVAATLVALRRLQSDRAVTAASAALLHREAQPAALKYLAQYGSRQQAEAVTRTAKTNPSFDVQLAASEALVRWTARSPQKTALKVYCALGELHGHSGQPIAWSVSGPLTDAELKALYDQLRRYHGLVSSSEFHTVMASDMNADIPLPRPKNAAGEQAWLAWTPFLIPPETVEVVSDGTSSTIRVATSMELLASATGKFKVELNGDKVYARKQAGDFRRDSDRQDLEVPPNTKLLVVEVRSADKKPRFHLRLRRRSSKAEHEALTKYALTTRGNLARGREVFLNAEKSSCIRCHRLGSEGGRIGPDLSGIGRRFSRIHLIESIMEPSRTVAPSYATTSLALTSGKVLSGIKVSEQDGTLILGDNQGKLHTIPTAEIEERTMQRQSTMPEGLEKKLTNREFIDLLAFLESLKTVTPKP